jgi:citrate lyase subunit beta/citryl-CoA lyase
MQGWRSLLFVPAHVDRFVAKAHTRGADAIILDLEDSVPANSKPLAREKACSSIATLTERGVNVGVRINHDLRNAVADLDAAVVAGTRFILLAKTMGAQHLQLVDQLIAELEAERGLAVGGIRLIALVETIAALAQIDDLAKACPRLSGIALGSEDLSADGEFEPTPQMLFNPSQALVFAARLAGIMAYAFYRRGIRALVRQNAHL